MNALTGWQGIAALAIASLLGLGAAAIAAFVPNGPAAAAAVVGLFNMAAGIVGGTFALLQRNRDPAARTRASDRIPTAAGGVPTYETTPPPEQLPPGRRR